MTLHQQILPLASSWRGRLLARLRHSVMSAVWVANRGPAGGKRTCRGKPISVAIDPTATLSARLRCNAARAACKLS